MSEYVYYTQGIEYKSFYDAETKSKRYFVKGHVSTEDIDLVNDIVTKNCISDMGEQLKSRSIKLDFDHETLRKGVGDSDFDAKLNLTKIPLGKSVSNEVDAKGNLVEFELNPNWKKFNSKGDVVMTFSEVWENVKSGFYDSFSIAYVPIKSVKQMVSDTAVRLLEKVNLINVALTGNPINPSATMTNVFAKSLNHFSEMEDIKSEISEIKSLIGGIMTKEQKSEEQEQTNAQEVESPKEEAPVETPKEEATAEAKSTEDSKEYVEAKSLVELKSKIEALEKGIEKISVLEKSLEKIDSLLSQAVTKSTGAEDKSKVAEVTNAVSTPSTLDLI